MIFGNKIFVSYFYGINPAQAENPIFPFKFQGPKRRPNDLEKYRHQYFGRWKTWERRKQANEGRKPKRGAHTASVPGRMGPTLLALEAPLPSIFPPPTSSWPKNTYKRSPTAFCGTSSATRQKHENKDLELQIGGGKLRQGAAGVVSIFSIDFSTVSMMKRE